MGHHQPEYFALEEAASTPRRSDTPNKLPPLRFHSIHGENIKISRDGSKASRERFTDRGIVFSDRPVRVDEKVCLRIAKISKRSDGFISFGFTKHDPVTLTDALSKTVYPYLTGKPGKWAKILENILFKKNDTLNFYFNSSGEVYFGINEEDKRLFFFGVDISSPLWALIDVNGKIRGIQFTDIGISNKKTVCPPKESSFKDMPSLFVEDSLPPLRYQTSLQLIPLSLHGVRGNNVQFEDNSVGVAARINSTMYQGYVFAANPVRLGQTIVVQILTTHNLSSLKCRNFAFGLTKCDPATLRTDDLPDSAEELMTRSEYWKVIRPTDNEWQTGDELALTLTLDGKVQESRNGSTPITVTLITVTDKLWMFVDICGSTMKIRMLSTEGPQSLENSSEQLPVLIKSGTPKNEVNDDTVVDGRFRLHKRPRTAASTEPNQTRSKFSLTSLPDVVLNQQSNNYNQCPRTNNEYPSIRDTKNVQLLKEHSKIRPAESVTSGPSTSRHQPVDSVKKEAPSTSRRSGDPQENSLLHFHSVHGQNICLSSYDSIAHRVRASDNGIVYSARPVKINEKVCLRLVDISKDWSKPISFGFTKHVPDLTHTLPKRAWPDLIDQSDIWINILEEKFCKKNSTLCYYVNTSGDVRLRINKEDEELFLSGVDITGPLWAIIDVHGKCTGVQLIDSRTSSQMKRPSLRDSLVGNVSALSVKESRPPQKYQNKVPLILHKTKGRNVQFQNDRIGVASRTDGRLCQGYVFTARPMCPGQTIVVQILATESKCTGSLAIGLTSCDPDTLRSRDLPDSSEKLMNRSEYWKLKNNIGDRLRTGDELAFTLTSDGKGKVSINGKTADTVLYVKRDLNLWAFVDIFGATKKIRMFSVQVSQPAQKMLPVSTESTALVNTGADSTALDNSIPPHKKARTSLNTEPIQKSAKDSLTSLLTITSKQSRCYYQQPHPSADYQCSLTSQNTKEDQPKEHMKPRPTECFPNGPSKNDHQPNSILKEGNLTITSLRGKDHKQPSCNYQKPHPSIHNQSSSTSQNTKEFQPKEHLKPRPAESFLNGPSKNNHQPIPSVLEEATITSLQGKDHKQLSCNYQQPHPSIHNQSSSTTQNTKEFQPKEYAKPRPAESFPNGPSKNHHQPIHSVLEEATITSLQGKDHKQPSCEYEKPHPSIHNQSSSTSQNTKEFQPKEYSKPRPAESFPNGPSKNHHQPIHSVLEEATITSLQGKDHKQPSCEYEKPHPSIHNQSSSTSQNTKELKPKEHSKPRPAESFPNGPSKNHHQPIHSVLEEATITSLQGKDHKQPSCEYEKPHPSIHNQSSSTSQNTKELKPQEHSKPRPAESFPNGPSKNDHQPNSILKEASSTTYISDTPNKLPSLRFHLVHGENICVLEEGSVARRERVSDKGITFSNRPVSVNEKVHFRFVEILKRRQGLMSFGFTRHDPVTLAYTLPACAYPDLINKPGNWANRLDTKYYKQDDILHFYVTSSGVIHFGINGEEKGMFLSGVDTSNPLWALIDVHGKTIRVQLTDPVARSKAMKHLTVDNPSENTVEESISPSRYQNTFVPLNLHKRKGKNVQFVNDRVGMAAKTEGTVSQGYVFTAHPIHPGQTIVIQILATDCQLFLNFGNLAYGITTCNPATLNSQDLPDIAEKLKDRSEYWVVRRLDAKETQTGDELALTLTVDGEVQVSRNGSTPITFTQINHPIWAFVDICGITKKIRMLSTQVTTLPTQPVLNKYAAPINAGALGTVLDVSLPPHKRARTTTSTESMQSTSQIYHTVSDISINQPSSNYQLHPRTDNQCLPASQNKQAQLPNDQQAETILVEPSTSRQQPVLSVISKDNQTDSDCIICFEKTADSVLYKCGHSRMCYECAVQQWKGMGGGKCPLCRQQIKDVIRTYK